jgi:uncharacterized protein (DUF302 family)
MNKILIIVFVVFVSHFSMGWTQLTMIGETGHETIFPDSRKEEMNIFLENESKYDFVETVEKLKFEIEKKTWKLTATHDLQQTLKNFGKEVLPVQVFAICHPKHSGKILEKDDERIVSSMMPCRISVYKKSNGKTYLSRVNTSAMAKNFGGLIEQVMTDSSNEVEEIISGIIIKK